MLMRFWGWAGSDGAIQMVGLVAGKVAGKSGGGRMNSDEQKGPE
jgi:hypothetical protein